MSMFDTYPPGICARPGCGWPAAAHTIQNQQGRNIPMHRFEPPAERVSERGPHAEDHQCRELSCCWCHQPYAVWFADNDLWNQVMRLPDGTDVIPFACPRCFLLHAETVVPVARISRPGVRLVEESDEEAW